MKSSMTEVDASAPSKVLRVLVAEDDPDSRALLQSAVLRLGYDCVVASDGLEAWERHQRDGADVILSDWSMPKLSGLRLCQHVRHHDSELAYTHFIFVTAQADRAHFREGMLAGADDYLPKPVQLDQLAARLEVARRAVMLHRQLVATNSVLRRDGRRASIAARTDPLTAVSNRLQLAEDLEGLVSRVARYGHHYCAALCDIDAFKAYNDRRGHLAGDDVLRRVANAVRLNLRSGDGFYRYGGEEFLAILPEQSLAEAAIGMDRIRAAVERLAIVHEMGAIGSVVTISIGIALLGAESIGGVDEWLRRSDLALYAAKGSGKNRVVVESTPPPSLAV